MKQVISLGSGMLGDEFVEVGDRKLGNLMVPYGSLLLVTGSRGMIVVQLVPDPNPWVQSTALDRHNFKGSLGITLECLQAFATADGKLVVLLLLVGDFVHVINLQ